MAKVATRSASLKLGLIEEKPGRDNLEDLVPIWEDDINMYIFFWVFPRRQIVVGRRFGTLCQFHLQRLDVDCEV